ncbi:CHAT domain-containing protein [Pyxidicoccus parkwayensis]|uniref:CHAT domain-containing protein n=1 Tax=Pyxidicoccus parkwayensis TaxID=2813578 RepID=A0ABX7NMN1_9BACT|nr:CHAT domain-containing protein [Pyxidicoccus parkwaysis]QSQ19908.1 CHAT domain-containing protein [Pyxidicoccus parkwaysis]
MATLCETVGRFVDGELGTEEAEAFRQHIPDCDTCQREMTELLQLKLLLRGQLERDARPAPEPLPPAPIPLFRRRSFVATLSALAASVLVVFGVRQLMPSGPPQDAWLVQRPERLLEARLGYPRADVYRPPASKTMSNNGAVEDLPHAAFAWLEEHDDVHGLAAAYLVRDAPGFAEHALQKLTELKVRSPEVENDRAVALLLAGRHKEALLLLDGVLREHPRHAQALWNRGLVLRELGLPLMAARSFSDVSALGEPGWADEAARKAEELRRATFGRRDRWKVACEAGKSLLDAPPDNLPRGFALQPIARLYFYDAIRAAPNRERVLALLPLAQELDARAGNTVLDAYVHRVAAADFTRRAPLARSYAALSRELPSREDHANFLKALRQSSEEDILLGSLLTPYTSARELDLFSAMARDARDSWFPLLAAETRAKRDLSEGHPKQALKALQDAGKLCPARGLEYRCLSMELLFADLYRQRHMVDDALDHAERGWKQARATNEWRMEEDLLWLLAQLARVVNDGSLTRAYLGEYLERGQGDPDAQRRAHQDLANMAFQELRVDEARREIDAALATGLPLSSSGAFVLADISRLKRAPGDEVHLNRALETARSRLGTGEHAVATHVLGRFFLEQDPERGRALLWHAIEEAEAPELKEDAAARRARAYSYTSLLHDAGRRGDFKAALDLFAKERGTRLPGQCLLAVTADSERTLLLVLSPSGELLGRFDESRRQPLPPRLEGLVPENLLAALRECSRVEVLARPPLHGRAGLLPPGMAWSYLTRTAPPAVQRTGPAVHLVVSGVALPPGSTLKRLNTWTPSFGPDEQPITLSEMEATPSRVLDAMRDATEIDLVAHGVINGTSDSSYLMLAPGPEDPEPELSVPQVRHASLRGAPFVVLAACHAAHTTYSLDTPFSLPAAFIDAGARGVLAATVEIPDLEAAAFFNAVRERIRSGAPPALALRDERMKWREQQRGASWLDNVLLFE